MTGQGHCLEWEEGPVAALWARCVFTCAAPLAGILKLTRKAVAAEARERLRLSKQGEGGGEHTRNLHEWLSACGNQPPVFQIPQLHPQRLKSAF